MIDYNKFIKFIVFITVATVFVNAQPTLIAYTPDTTVDVTPTLYWNSVSGASIYQIQIDDDNTFTTPLVDEQVSGATNYTPISPLSNGHKYWRVSSDLDFASFSSPDDFEIKTFPDLNVYSPNPTSDNTPTVAWQSVSGASNYRLQVDDVATFASPNIDTTISGATSYNFFLPGSDTLASNTYYWRIATNYDSSAFSPNENINYQEVNLTRFNGSVERNASPSFFWNSYSGATDYRIQIASNMAFTTPVVDYYTSGATNYNSASLGIGTKYWRVSTNYDYTSFGRMDSLRISGSPVPVFFNGDTIYTSKPKLVWHKLAGMPSNGSYHIQIDTTRWFTSGMWDGNVYADTNGIVDTTFIPYSNLHDGKWYWRVDSAYMGDYSEIDSFYVKDTTTGWYVRIGATGGDGSKNLPFGSLNDGAKYLTNGDTLYVSEGIYAGDTINIYSVDSITIIGGYDTTFSVYDPWQYITEIDGVDTATQANVTFQKNVIIDGFTFKRFTGNAIYMYDRKNITIKNCVFKDNYTGVYIDRGRDNRIENNIFINNGYGVKLYSWEIADSINLSIKNNTFIKNDSSAIRNDSMGVDVRNNIIAFNKYGYQSKGGKVDTLAYNSFFSNDSLFYNHFFNFKYLSIDSLENDSNFITLSNYNLDPKFKDTMLVSIDLHLDSGSACFDLGDPTSDYSLEPIPNGGRINLGAFGGTQWASVAGTIPQISTEPTIDTVSIGDSLIFTVIATGTTPLSYQWQKEGSNLAGQTSSSYIVDSVVMSDTGNYRVIVSNSFGSDTSVNLSFRSIKPTVAINAYSDTAYLNDTINFTTTILGTQPITYQWLKDDSIIPGGVGPILNFVADSLNKGGAFKVIAYNDFGIDTSDIEGLIIIDNIPPDPVTALTLTEVNCSTIAVSWTPSASNDVVDIMICASTISMPATQDSGEYSKLVSVPVSSTSITGLPSSGLEIFLSVFVKDNSGNWSSFSSVASDSIKLSDGEPPLNHISLNIINYGDTAIALNLDVNDTIPTDVELIVFNMNTDSANIRYSEQDTFSYNDTTLYRSINAQGNYYISWIPIDSSGNIGPMLSDTFTLQNSLPHFVFGDSVILSEDAEWVMENFVDDYNLDPIKVNIIEAPATLILDTLVNKIIWTPLNEDVGQHLLILSADDQIDGAVIDTLKILVQNTNDYPVIQTLEISDTIMEGSVVSGTITVKDPDLFDSLNLTIDSISWISFSEFIYSDSNLSYSSTLTLSPAKVDTGIAIIKLIVNDIAGALDTVNKQIYVINSNFPPEIKNVTLLDTVYEDSVVEGYIEVFDANTDDSLQVIMDGASWLNIKLDTVKTDGSKLYVLKGIPLQVDTGTISIKFTVVDMEGELDTLTKMITVLNTNDAPIIQLLSKKVSSGSAEYIMKANDDFDTAFVYNAGVISVDGDTVFAEENGTGVFLIYPMFDGSYIAYTSVTDQGGLNSIVYDSLIISNVNNKIWASSNSWDMVSVPSEYYTVDSSINNEIIQYWDESKPFRNIYQYYNRVTDPTALQSTSSYWIKNDGVDINISLDTAMIKRNNRQIQSVSIKLNMDSYGWNMISSPFVYPVSWNSDLTLWEWDSKSEEYVDAQNIMYPWKGYWVLAESNNDSVTLNSTPNMGMRRRRGIANCRFKSHDQWIYNLKLSSELGNDNENLFGFNENASDNKDRYDRAEPPRLNQKPYAYFYKSEWKGKVKEYASDIRKSWKGLATYNIGINTGSLTKQNVCVKIEGIKEEHKNYVFVRNGENIIQYKDGDEILVSSSGSEKFITLFVTSDRDFLKKIPLTFRAYHPYPNPFKNIANLKYTLPYRWENNGLLISKPYNVKINVYDVKGRVVRELLNGKQNVGLHKVIWNGKVNGGRLASSGAYFVKISAGDFVTVKKIMVLK